MKKILFVLAILLIPLNCFASQPVHIINSTDEVNLAMDSRGNIMSNLASSASAGVITVSTTATTLGTANTYSVTITNSPTAKEIFYVGDSSLTSGNGYMVSSGEVVTLNIDNLSDLYVLKANTGDLETTYLYYVAQVK